ncbi:MAG: tetratricopeptide repeat protein [Cyclobacteriaceae bacterium]
MARITRQLLFSFIAFLTSSVYCHATENTDDVYEFSPDFQLEIESLNKGFQRELLLQARIDSSITKKDTLAAISALLDLSHLYTDQGDYSKSYDGFWEVLRLAELKNSDISKALSFYGLGWLYDLYGQTQKASEYFNLSLNICTKIEPANDNDQVCQLILNNYYGLANQFRKLNDVKQASIYLDSCKNLPVYCDLHSNDNIFIMAEEAYLMFLSGNNEEARKLLHTLTPIFQVEDPSYLIILYPFLGKIYNSMGEIELSESYFKSALEISKKLKSHIDLVPDIHQNLANIYKNRREFELALWHTSEAQRLNEIQFSSRSTSNQGLLEIKDSYRLEKELQNNLNNKRRLEQLEQENRISKLKTVILVGAIFFILIIGLVIYRHLRSKYKAEKRWLKHQRELEIQKAKEVLEIKNKELTASALHSIEREELLSEVKNELAKLKQNPEYKDLGKLMKNIDVKSTKSWEEFEVRFTAVNEEFYTRLKEKFPSLGQSDHRLCALIKLNFSSKDIARLLGISTESVHTTRYRLRKKLGLNRQDNLENFIARV